MGINTAVCLRCFAEYLPAMIDSDEEFDSINGNGPNPVVEMFRAELPKHLQEKIVPLTYFVKVKLLARGSFGKLFCLPDSF